MGQKVLGLDMGSFSVKAALFDTTFRTYELTDLFESAPLKMDDLDLPEQQAVLTEAILRLMEDNQIQPSTVVIGIPGSDVSTKDLILPLPEAQVEKVLPFELESFLPFELSDLIIDHHVISSSKSETHVLAAAAQKALIEERLKVAQNAGIEPAFIGLESAYLFNLFLMQELPPFDIFGIIDLGHTKTSICLIQNGQAHHIRSLYKGGRDLTDAIRSNLEMTYDQALEVKHQHGIIELPGESLRSEDLQRLSSAIKTPIDELVNEIQQTINAYLADIHSRDDTLTLKQLYLCGGTSMIKNLPEYITASLDIPCSIYEAPHVQLEKTPVLAQAIALGLRASLRGASAKKLISFNFRKAIFSMAKDMSGIKDIALFFSKWVFTIFLLSLFFKGFQYYNLAYEKNKIETQILSEFKRIMPDAKTPKTGSAALKQMTSKIQEYKNKQEILTAGLGSLTALSILKEVSANIPDDLTIDTQELSIDRNKVTLKATTDSLESVDRIIGSLKTFEKFNQIDKGDIRETGEGKKLFTINITIGGDSNFDDDNRRNR
ncbi:MAG: pilus assembly protein PilM [Bdellovibrionales bacterium]|nr:pilus assembly protein PilM [Bdellovibrionales bacterium]